MRYAIHNSRQCPDCGEHAAEAVCWNCNAEGCRECIRPIIGSDGEVWYVCERCKEWEAIAEAIRDEDQKTVAVAR